MYYMPFWLFSCMFSTHLINIHLSKTYLSRNSLPDYLHMICAFIVFFHMKLLRSIEHYKAKSLAFRLAESVPWVSVGTCYTCTPGGSSVECSTDLVSMQ